MGNPSEDQSAHPAEKGRASKEIRGAPWVKICFFCFAALFCFMSEIPGQDSDATEPSATEMAQPVVPPEESDVPAPPVVAEETEVPVPPNPEFVEVVLEEDQDTPATVEVPLKQD